MKIVTNNQPRDLLTWYDLTLSERKEFDYLAEGEGSFLGTRAGCMIWAMPCELKAWQTGRDVMVKLHFLGFWCGILRSLTK